MLIYYLFQQKNVIIHQISAFIVQHRKNYEKCSFNRDKEHRILFSHSHFPISLFIKSGDIKLTITYHIRQPIKDYLGSQNYNHIQNIKHNNRLHLNVIYNPPEINLTQCITKNVTELCIIKQSKVQYSSIGLIHITITQTLYLSKQFQYGTGSEIYIMRSFYIIAMKADEHIYISYWYGVSQYCRYLIALVCTAQTQ